MLELFNKLLSKLPLNGKKSIVGALLAALVWAFPHFPLGQEHLEKIVEYSGYFYLIVGLLHKWIKSKL